MDKVEFTINFPLKVSVSVESSQKSSFGDKFYIDNGTHGHVFRDGVVIYFPDDRFNTDKYVRVYIENSRGGKETLVPDDRLDLVDEGLKRHTNDIMNIINNFEKKYMKKQREKIEKEVKGLADEL